MPTVAFDLWCFIKTPPNHLSQIEASIILISHYAGSVALFRNITFTHLQVFIFKITFTLPFLIFGCCGCHSCSSSNHCNRWAPRCHIIMKPQILYRAPLVCLLLFGSYENVVSLIRLSSRKIFSPPYLANYPTFRAKCMCVFVCVGLLKRVFAQSSICPLLLGRVPFRSL